MKHLYWIICGALVVGLLVTWFIILPTEDARASKEKLDRQSEALKNLDQRAARGSPTGVFDAENPADTQRLANDYLITESWKKELQPLVLKYQDQFKEIKSGLIKRNAYLRVPVAKTTNTLEWYNAYVQASEALVTKLQEAGCLRAPRDAVRAAGGESPADIRATVGLYNRSGSYPDPKEHAQITARLRVMELLAERLAAARIAIADNPQVGATGRSDDRARAAAMITSVAWTSAGAGDQLTLPITTGISNQLDVRALGLTLTLDGPLSALLAASAALEINDKPEWPLVAVTSASLSRRDNQGPGERFDAAAETVHLVLNLSIIEFAELAGANP